MTPPHNPDGDRGTRQVARDRLVIAVRERIQRAGMTVFGAREVQEPIFAGYRITGPTLDDPLAGVRAARLVTDIAAGQVRDWALRARGAGHDWAEIAHALELPTLDGRPDGPGDGEAAFEWLVENRAPAPGPELPVAASTTWTCRSCQAQVRDRGPFNSHPDDREQGHAPGCARHHGALTAWRHDLDHDQQQHEHEQQDEQDDEPGQDDEGGGGGRR